MNAVLEYYKATFTIKYYAKDKSYAKEKGTPSEPKYTRCARRRAAMAGTASSTSEEFTGLNTYNDGTFTLDGKFYPLKAFAPEDIYLGKLSKDFWDACR